MKNLQVFFLCLFLAAGTALHAEVEPLEKLQRTVDAALEVVYGECCQDLPMEEKQLKVRERIEQEYNLDVIIRRAFGRNWTLLSAEEQVKTTQLVKNLIVKAYFDGLEGKAKPEVSFGETVKVTDTRIEIPSAVRADGRTFHVVYRLGRVESGWEIYDIVAENISIVSNYRQQFDDHFRRGSGAELIAKLENLLAKPHLDEEIRL